MNSMEQTREFLKSICQPGGDLYTLPTSEKRFDDGGQYRFEVPGIQSPKNNGHTFRICIGSKFNNSPSNSN